MLSRRRRRRRGCAAAASAALNTPSDCSIFALRLKCNLLLLQPQRQSASLPSSPPSLPFSLTPHVSAQLNVIISNCLWAAAALLPLTISGCLPFAPLPRLPIPYPPQQRATHFAHFFLYCFFRYLCIGFPSLVSFGAKFFLRQLHFLPLFAALATHICQLSNATPSDAYAVPFPYPF